VGSRRLTRGATIAFLVTGLLVLPSAPAALGAIPSGNQLRLDGVDDYASIPDNASLDLGDEEGEDFTIEAFVHVPDETSDAVQVIFYKHSAYRLSVSFHTATDDVLILGVWRDSGAVDQLLVSSTLTTGWHHIAGVFDNEFSPSNDRLSIYLDGAQVADNSTAFDYTPGINNSTNPLSVGANSGGVPWVGWMDEARFSDSVRYSGAYSVPTSPFTSDANTRALWHFDNMPCTTSFADSSDGGNTLTGQNGAVTGVQGAAAPTLLFSADSYFVNEGDGSATITVSREGDPLPVVGVNHTTADGTATAGEDYTDSDGTLAFACGDVEETFDVPITTDSEVEGDETVSLALDTPTGGSSLGIPSAASLTIFDQDVTAPETTIESGPSGFTNDDTPTFTFSSPEGSSTFECRVDTDPFTACVSPHTTAALTDGAHTFEVRATDGADNTDPTPASRSFTVDTQGPLVSIDSGPDGPTNDSTPTFTFSADEPVTFACKVDADPFGACSGPGDSHTPAPLADGEHTFSVRGTDQVNLTATDSRTFTVDTSPPIDPVLDSTSHDPEVISHDRTVDITWSGAADALSGVDGFSFLWDASPSSVPDQTKGAEETATGTTSPPLAEGNDHWFHLRTVDNAGNWTGTAHLGPFWIDQPFTDIDGSFAYDEIWWLHETGITLGCNPPVQDRFCPTDPVRRDQMASFLVRALDLPATATDYFEDDEGSVHEADINAIKLAGITQGCNPPTNDLYCPSLSVRRDQMASFIARALALPDPVDDYFTDDEGSVHEADINKLFEAGITFGCNPPTNDLYCPDQPVTREQMAAFLYRALAED
jgi:hypothetical protein